MSATNHKELFSAALSALKNAHGPYTGRKAGAAARLRDGRLFSGANVESPAFYGYESLETVVGRMIVESNWARDGLLPEITELLYCFDEKWDENGSYRPGPYALSLLKIFAAPDLKIIFADKNGKVFEEISGKSLLSPLPAPDFNKDAFAQNAKDRYAAAQTAISHTDNQESLYNARLQAFDPVSRYAVGAMVETACGHIFHGCNVEIGGNKALHAEAVAVAVMVTVLGPAARIRRVTILTGGAPGYPCGGCRQHINEFATPQTIIVATNTKGARQEITHGELLPHSFGHADLASVRGGK